MDIWEMNLCAYLIISSGEIPQRESTLFSNVLLRQCLPQRRSQSLKAISRRPPPTLSKVLLELSTTFCSDRVAALPH